MLSVFLKKILFPCIVVLLVLETAGCRKFEEPEKPVFFNFILDVPPAGTTDVDPRVLLGWGVWSNLEQIDEVDLYFGTDSPPPFLAKISQKECNRYRPGPLKPNQTYYWRVSVPSPGATSKIESFRVNRDRMLWDFSLGRGHSIYDLGGWPVVYEGKVYQMGTNGNFYCLDAVSGTLLWTFSTNTHSILGDSLAAAGRVYFSGGRQLFCLDAQNGAVLWIVDNPDPNYGRRLSSIMGEKIFCYTSMGIYALEASTGAEIWRVDRGISGVICTGNEKVFFANKDQNDALWMECLDAETGATLWASSVSSISDWIVPEVANERLFFIYKGVLFCCDAGSGILNWKVESRPDIIGYPVLIADKVFLSAKDNQYLLLNARDGTILWEKRVTVPVELHSVSSLVSVRDSLIFSTSGFLFCLDVATGNFRWQYFISRRLSGLAVFGNRVYAAGDDEYLHCLNTD